MRRVRPRRGRSRCAAPSCGTLPTRIVLRSRARPGPTRPSPVREVGRDPPAGLVAVAGDEAEGRSSLVAARLGHEEGAVLGADQRGQLGHDQLRHGLAGRGGPGAWRRCGPGWTSASPAPRCAWWSRARLTIIWLMLSLRSPTSPAASTVMVRVRSPWVTAVATSAMERTWVVRFAGQLVHVLGQALPGAGHALHLGLAAELALGAHLAGHPGDLGGEGRELVDHLVDRCSSARGSRPGRRR